MIKNDFNRSKLELIRREMVAEHEKRKMEELDRQKMINITVIEPASPPIAPSSLSKKIRVLMGAFVGLFAGGAAAVFLELVRPS